MSGDKLVGIVGILMALVIVSHGGTLRAMPGRKRALFAAAWAVIIGLIAAIAARMTA